MAITFSISHKLSDEEIYIRTAVFVQEQKFNEEFDTIDNNCTHIVLYENGKAAACCRFFKGDKANEYYIGRVACLKDYRGKSYGRMIMEKAEEEIRKLGGKIIAVSAQLRISRFYEGLGYTKMGEIYLDEYCEHIHMEKELKSFV